MTSRRRELTFTRQLLIVGTGCIAQGFLPLLFRHIDLRRDQVTLAGPDDIGRVIAQRYGVRSLQLALARDNYSAQLARLLEPSDCLVNLALGVGSLDLLAWCQKHGVTYLDTNLEPWAGHSHLVHEARAKALAMRQFGASTAVIAHGANPGLISHFLKQALCDISAATIDGRTASFGRDDWSSLASKLGVRVVTIAEYDSQVSSRPSASHEFANTWSARGLADELAAPPELALGDHETNVPSDAHMTLSSTGRALVLSRAAETVLVTGWTPGIGEFTGLLLAHHEAFSVSDLLTPAAGPGRPTVFYAYRPCAEARRSALEFKAWQREPRKTMRVLTDELIAGSNELGVLLFAPGFTYWFGSRLSLAAARNLAPDNNATTLQVSAGVLVGLIWALENPCAGIVEAEDMDFRRALAIAGPYLGQLGGVRASWRPLGDAASASCPGFEQFRVPVAAKSYDWRRTDRFRIASMP